MNTTQNTDAATVKPAERIFFEYLVSFNDVDAGDEYWTILQMSEIYRNNSAEQAEKIIARNYGWMFGGNTIETDVVQETGKAVLCQLNARQKYETKELIKERTDDVKEEIEELRKAHGHNFLA